MKKKNVEWILFFFCFSREEYTFLFFFLCNVTLRRCIAFGTFSLLFLVGSCFFYFDAWLGKKKRAWSLTANKLSHLNKWSLFGKKTSAYITNFFFLNCCALTRCVHLFAATENITFGRKYSLIHIRTYYSTRLFLSCIVCFFALFSLSGVYVVVWLRKFLFICKLQGLSTDIIALWENGLNKNLTSVPSSCLQLFL